MSKTIQINKCAAEELERLPQVGPKTAQKIVVARPIEDAKALEELLPPSAWLAIEERGVQFDFGATESEPEEILVPEGESLVMGHNEMLTNATVRAAEPQIQLFEPETMTLRRVPANDRLREGARYFCIWNVHWGPSGEAMFPADAPVQAEIEAWFNAHSMGIVFAHYGRSLQIGTRSRGYVPLLLFEIMEETEEAEDARENDGTGQGN